MHAGPPPDLGGPAVVHLPESAARRPEEWPLWVSLLSLLLPLLLLLAAAFLSLAASTGGVGLAAANLKARSAHTPYWWLGARPPPPPPRCRWSARVGCVVANEQTLGCRVRPLRALVGGLCEPF